VDICTGVLWSTIKGSVNEGSFTYSLKQITASPKKAVKGLILLIFNLEYITFLFLFCQYWGLNSGNRLARRHSTLEPHLQLTTCFFNSVSWIRRWTENPLLLSEVDGGLEEKHLGPWIINLTRHQFYTLISLHHCLHLGIFSKNERSLSFQRKQLTVLLPMA
jgi:hypothetical protein